MKLVWKSLFVVITRYSYDSYESLADIRSSINLLEWLLCLPHDRCMLFCHCITKNIVIGGGKGGGGGQGGRGPPTFSGFYIAAPHFYTKLMVKPPHFEFTSSAYDCPAYKIALENYGANLS